MSKGTTADSSVELKYGVDKIAKAFISKAS